MELSQAQHALISGGASGLGLAIADALRARGVAVTIADINEEALASVAADGDPALRGALLDTRDREGWSRIKAEAEAAFGPVDILVNNAGIGPDGRPFSEMDPQSFDRILAINLVGIFNGVSAFAAGMKARGRGHIVNTSSQAGLTATVPGIGAYAVAKFGVTALTEALRIEMAPHGVGVTLLAPGWVHTNLGENTRRLGGDLRDSGTGVLPPSDVTAKAVGEMVMVGIEQNAPYIITHKGFWPAIERRMNELHRACAARDTA